MADLGLPPGVLSVCHEMQNRDDFVLSWDVRGDLSQREVHLLWQKDDEADHDTSHPLVFRPIATAQKLNESIEEHVEENKDAELEWDDENLPNISNLQKSPLVAPTDPTWPPLADDFLSNEARMERLQNMVRRGLDSTLEEFRNVKPECIEAILSDVHKKRNALLVDQFLRRRGENADDKWAHLKRPPELTYKLWKVSN